MLAKYLIKNLALILKIKKTISQNEKKVINTVEIQLPNKNLLK